MRTTSTISKTETPVIVPLSWNQLQSTSLRTQLGAKSRYLETLPMCDYSLEAYRSQPAATAESYVLDRFPSGSKGFTTEPGCKTAVCLMADTKVRLEGIAPEVQVALGIGETEEVTMTRLDIGPYRDAVRFANGQEVVIQRLNTGIIATVLGIRSGIEREIEIATSPRELVDA